MDGGGTNFQCSDVANGCGCGYVRALDQESMKRFSLESQNLTKLKRMTSSICIRFFMINDICL